MVRINLGLLHDVLDLIGMATDAATFSKLLDAAAPKFQSEDLEAPVLSAAMSMAPGVSERAIAYYTDTYLLSSDQAAFHADVQQSQNPMVSLLHALINNAQHNPTKFRGALSAFMLLQSTQWESKSRAVSQLLQLIHDNRTVKEVFKRALSNEETEEKVRLGALWIFGQGDFTFQVAV